MACGSQRRIEPSIHRCCWGRLEESLAGLFWWRSYARWGELVMKEAKKKAKFDGCERWRQHHMKYLFCLSKLWVSPLAVSSKVLLRSRAIIFPKYLCLFEHLLIHFSHVDGNLSRKVASLLHDLPFCLKLACCQVSTTFFRNPAFSLVFFHDQ